MRLLRWCLLIILVSYISIDYYFMEMNNSNALNAEVANKTTEGYSILIINENIDIDVKDIIDKFDTMILDVYYSDNSTVVTYYQDDIKEISGLYGSQKPCVVPFTSTTNNCGYYTLSMLNRTGQTRYYSLTQFDEDSVNISGMSRYSVMIKSDNLEEFTNYFIEKYDIEREKISFSGANQADFYQFSSYKRQDKLNYLFIILLILSIVLNIANNKKRYSISAINGVNKFRIYLRNIFKEIIYDVVLLTVVMGVSYLIFMYLTNDDFVSKYVITLKDNLIYYTVLFNVISLLTFLIVYEDSTYKLLRSRSRDLILLTFIVVTSLSSVFIQAKYLDFKADINALQSILTDKYNAKVFEGYYKYSLNYNRYDDLPVEELDGILDTMKNEMFVTNIFHSSTLVMSKSYAELMFDYEFEDGNYILGNESYCSTSGLVDSLDVVGVVVPNTYKYKMSDYYNFKDEYILDIENCVIVIDSIEGYERQFHGYEIYTSFISKDLVMDKFDKELVSKNSSPILDTSIYTNFFHQIFSALIVTLTNILLFIFYLKTFSKYEYIKYIYDRKYFFAKTYVISKLCYYGIITTILLYYGKIEYLLYILVIDIVLYLILRFKYLNNLVRLGE